MAQLIYLNDPIKSVESRFIVQRIRFNSDLKKFTNKCVGSQQASRRY